MSVDISTLNLEVRSDGVLVATGRLDDLAKKGKKAEESTESLTSSISKMSAFIQTAAAGFAAWKLSQYIKDATLLAARVETLGVVMKVVGANAGYTSSQMDAFTSGLKKMGITTQESMSSLIKMAGAQMDLTKSSQLARVAQDAAVIGGINSSEAFGRMIQGIRSGEVEILKTIGISVQFEQGYKQMAASLGKTSNELTNTEKTASRMNQVLAFGSNIAGAYEASMSTAGKQMLSMARYSEELKLKVGQLFTPVLTTGVENFVSALKLVDRYFNAIKITVAASLSVLAGYTVLMIASSTAGGAMSSALALVATRTLGVTASMLTGGGVVAGFGVTTATTTVGLAGMSTAMSVAAGGTGLFAAATKAATVAMHASKAAFVAHPIGIFIALITTAIGLWYTYKMAHDDAMKAPKDNPILVNLREEISLLTTKIKLIKQGKGLETITDDQVQELRRLEMNKRFVQNEGGGSGNAFRVAAIEAERIELEKGIPVAAKLRQEFNALTTARDASANSGTEAAEKAAKLAEKAAKEAERAAAAAEQWRVTYADLRKEIDGLAPGMDEYSRKVADVNNKYTDLAGKQGANVALLTKMKDEHIAALTVQQDLSTAEDNRLITEKRLSEEYERQLDHARDLANIKSANDTAAASLVGTNAIGGFDSVADETANRMAVEQDAHNQKMSYIATERQAELTALMSGEKSYKQYTDKVKALDKETALEKQKNSKATGKIADDGYRSSLAAASNYTGAASDAFTLLASTQDQSSRSGFESAKAYSIAAAVMNTAAGIMSAFASLPWPAAPIAAALVAATGVVQIAKISSTSFGGGSGSVSAPSGSFSGSATGSGSAIGGSYSSIADRQSNATMTRLADATENASVNMRKVSDGLVKFSGMLDGDADQRALGTVNGQYATLESQKSAMTALMTGGLSNIGSTSLKKIFEGNFQGWNDDQNKTTLAVSGLTSMFGWGNSWKQTGSGVSLGVSGGELDGQGYVDSTKKGGWFSSDKKKTKYSDLSEGFAEMLSDALLGMSSNIGLSAAILGTSSNIGSVSIPRAKIAAAGRSTEDIQKDVETWLQNVGNAYAKTVVGLQEYTYAGEEAYAALMRLTISLQTVNESFSLIGKTMLDSTIAGGNYASKLIDLMGGNAAFSESMDTYFNTMFTQAEQEAMKAAQAAKDVSVAFAVMGLTAPKTNLEFRNLVNSIDVTTEHGAGLYDALMDIVPAFGLMTDAAEEAAKTLRDTFLDTALSAANALKDIMGGELSTLSPEEKYRAQQKAFADAQAAGRTAELPELGKALLTASRSYNGSSAGYTADYATVTAALSDVAGMTDSPSLRAANAQVQLLTDIRAILDGGTGNLTALTGQLKYGSDIGNAMGTPDPSAYVGVSWFDKTFDSRKGRANNYNDNSDLIDEIRAMKDEVVKLRRESVGALNSIDTKARLAVNE